MNRLQKLSVAVVSMLLAINALSASLIAQNKSSEQIRHSIDIKSIATTVKPCQDFYTYADGQWLEHNPIPADRSSWGSRSELYEKNLVVLHQILSEWGITNNR